MDEGKPDASSATVETQVGATIEHAISPDTVQTPQKVIVPELQISEVPIEYSLITKKAFLVGSYPWNTTQSAGTSIINFQLPGDVLSNQQLLQGFQNMKYWRGTVVLTILVNSTQWHQGLLVLCWAPMTSMDAYQNSRPSNSLIMQSNIGIGYIHANIPVAKEVTIPFIAPTNYIDINDATTTAITGMMGMFGIHVFSPLTVGTGTTTSVDVSVYVSLQDSEFHLPRLLTLTENSAQRRARYREQPQMFRVLSGVSKAITTGAGLIRTSASAASNIVSKGKDALDILSRMDRENQQEIGVYVVDKSTTMGANTIDKPLPFDKLAMDSRELAPSTAAHFSSNEDECDFGVLLRRSCLFASYTWSTTQSTGTQLASYLITPTMYLTNVNTLTSSITMPVMDYIAAPFQFWRGSVIIKIIVVATNFATGSLRISMVYGSNQLTATFDQSNSQYFSILDLKEGKHEYEYELPFQSNTVMKNVNVEPVGSISPGSFQAFSTGILYVHVVNALAVANGAPTTVQVFMFSSGKDMEFFAPGILPFAPATPWYASDSNRIVPLDEAVIEPYVDDDLDVPQAERVVLGTGGSNVSTTTPVVRVVSIRDQIRRIFLYNYFTPTTSYFGTQVLESNVYGLNGPTIPLVYWSSAFAGRRGGLRWRVATYSGDFPLMVVWNPDGNDVTVAQTYQLGASMGNCCQSVAFTGTAAEVESSFTSRLNFLISPFAVDPGTQNAEFTNAGALNAYWLIQTAGHAYSWNLWVGGADDLRFGGFLGPPPMNVITPY